MVVSEAAHAGPVRLAARTGAVIASLPVTIATFALSVVRAVATVRNVCAVAPQVTVSAPILARATALIFAARVGPAPTNAVDAVLLIALFDELSHGHLPGLLFVAVPVRNSILLDDHHAIVLQDELGAGWRSAVVRPELVVARAAEQLALLTHHIVRVVIVF